MEKESAVQTIRTTNLYEDAGVERLLDGEKSTLANENGIVVFVRPATKVVLEAIAAFNSGAKLNALQYSQVLKRRRGEMLAFKNGGGR